MPSNTQIAFEFDETSPVKPSTSAPKEVVQFVAPKTKSKRGRKSLKEMVGDAEMIQLPPDEELNKKLYYSIGEVGTMFNLNPSSLRYWESEFKNITPRKNKKGDRFYTVAEIKKLQLIYFLLRQRKYTIEGAKDYIKKYKDDSLLRYDLIKSLQEIKSFLLNIKADL
ncbi:MAG: MerR family transcriptional regulator [Chitinophagaceae bacterium]|jgi:DNA-binding transcriptional MerR regulator